MAYQAESHQLMQQCPSDVSTKFLSHQNVNVIQKRLALAVKARTGYAISRQSDVELMSIMQSVHEAFSNNTGGAKEVSRLNDIVLDIVVDQVVAGIEAYFNYLKDASTLPEPLPRGTFASIKGERMLPFRVPNI